MAKAKAKMKEFYREAALTYAKTNTVASIKALKKMDDGELAKAIHEFVKGEKTEGYFCPSCVGDSPALNYVQKGKAKGKPIQDEDTFCWYCGKDVVDDDAENPPSGGYGKHAVPRGKGVEVKDNTGEDDPPEEEEAEAEAEEVEEEAEAEEEETETTATGPVETAEEEPAEETEKEVVPLADRIATIMGLARKSGADAHRIGAEILEIKNFKLWKGEHDTYGDFCTNGLHMSRQMVYAYQRIAENFTLEEASGCPIFSLVEIAKLDKKSERKAALKKIAAGADTQAIKKLVAGMRDKGGDTSARPERAPSSPFKTSVGTQWSSKQDGNKAIFDTGDGIGLELTILKSKLKVEVIELADDSEEEEE